MLKVNVGLSRKLSRDFNSTGFTVNLEGEVAADLSDTEAVITKIQHYYDTAEEALLRQIERHDGDAAIASRDQEPSQVPPSIVARSAELPRSPSKQSPPSQRADGGSEAATNRQVTFLLNLGKRYGLTKPQLENRIAEILGQRIGVYDLTKRDAGVILDSLTASNKQTATR